MSKEPYTPDIALGIIAIAIAISLMWTVFDLIFEMGATLGCK